MGPCKPPPPPQKSPPPRGERGPWYQPQRPFAPSTRRTTSIPAPVAQAPSTHNAASTSRPTPASLPGHGHAGQAGSQEHRSVQPGVSLLNSSSNPTPGAGGQARAPRLMESTNGKPSKPPNITTSIPGASPNTKFPLPKQLQLDPNAKPQIPLGYILSSLLSKRPNTMTSPITRFSIPKQLQLDPKLNLPQRTQIPPIPATSSLSTPQRLLMPQTTASSTPARPSLPSLSSVIPEALLKPNRPNRHTHAPPSSLAEPLYPNARLAPGPSTSRRPHAPPASLRPDTKDPNNGSMLAYGQAALESIALSKRKAPPVPQNSSYAPQPEVPAVWKLLASGAIDSTRQLPLFQTYLPSNGQI